MLFADHEESTDKDEGSADPAAGRNGLVEDKHRRHDADDIGNAGQRISLAERENLQDIHPQESGAEEKHAANSEPPVRRISLDNRPGPLELRSTHHSKLQSHLPAHKQETLHKRIKYQSQVHLPSSTKDQSFDWNEFTINIFLNSPPAFPPQT